MYLSPIVCSAITRRMKNLVQVVAPPVRVLIKNMRINHLKVIFVALLLTGCSEKPSELPAPSPGKPYQVRCIESLPEFTLGLDSKPTKAQEIALCSCIWQELGG